MKPGVRLLILMLMILATQSSHGQDQPSDEIVRGNSQFQYWCAACHGASIGNNGQPHVPGTMALLAKYKGAEPALLEERKDLSPEFVTAVVRHGISVMPFFRKTEISDADLSAISAYLTRNNAR